MTRESAGASTFEGRAVPLTPYLIAMHRQTKRAILAALIQAGRRDLAEQVVTAAVKFESIKPGDTVKVGLQRYSTGSGAGRRASVDKETKMTLVAKQWMSDYHDDPILLLHQKGKRGVMRAMYRSREGDVMLRSVNWTKWFVIDGVR